MLHKVPPSKVRDMREISRGKSVGTHDTTHRGEAVRKSRPAFATALQTLYNFCATVVIAGNCLKHSIGPVAHGRSPRDIISIREISFFAVLAC